MHKSVIIGIFLVLLVVVVECKKSSGVLELDDQTFDKIVDGTKTVFIEFVEYAWKSSADFKNVGTEFVDNKDILIVTVELNDSPNLKKRFEIEESQSVYKLLSKGSTEAILYTGNVNTGELVDFVAVHAYPKLTSLKELAKDFVNSVEQSNSVQKAEEIIKELSQYESGIASHIVGHMKQIVAKGKNYVKSEKTRITGLLETKLAEEKKKNFRRRLVTLGLFDGPVKTAKDEL